MIPGNGLGDVISLIGNVEGGSHKSIYSTSAQRAQASLFVADPGLENQSAFGFFLALDHLLQAIQVARQFIDFLARFGLLPPQIFEGLFAVVQQLILSLNFGVDRTGLAKNAESYSARPSESDHE